MLMWLDRQGNLIDTIIVHTPDYMDFVTSAVFSSRGTILISGNVTWANFVAEISLDGTVRWYHCLISPDSAMQGILSVCETTSGNCVVSGYAQVILNPGNEFRFWLVWIDSLGHIYNEQVIDIQSAGFNSFMDVRVTATNDGGVLTAGNDWGAIFLMKLNAEGNEVWRHWHFYPERSFTQINAIREMPEEDILIVGQWQDNFGDDFFLLCCDPVGNLRWCASPALPGQQRGYHVIRTMEGRYLVVGEGYWPGSTGPTDVLVASYERSGILHDFVVLHTNFWAAAYAATQLADCTLILGGDGDIYRGAGSSYPGFYAVHLTADSRIPAPSTPFDLLEPSDQDTLINTSPIVFAWRSSSEPDPLDTVQYTLRIWDDLHSYQATLLDTAYQVSDSLLNSLGGGWKHWHVTAHSHRPDTSVVSMSERMFYLSQLDAPSQRLGTAQFPTLAMRPNPFNSITQIEFTLPVTQRVSLRLYDVLGREVAVLLDEMKTAGEHRISFDGSALSSGVYFCRMEAGREMRTNKIVLMK